MAAAGRPEDIFGPLLERPAFRADLLYFIRLAGNYAALLTKAGGIPLVPLRKQGASSLCPCESRGLGRNKPPCRA